MDLLKGNDEDCIRYFKSYLKEEGYKYIKEESDRILAGFLEPERLKIHHLLSIARWEYQRETGIEPVGIDSCFTCGLCLYQRSLPGDSGQICIRGDRCILISECGCCCNEFYTSNIDNGLALIQRLRREYINKYYKEEKKMVEKFWMVNSDSREYGTKEKFTTKEEATEEARKLCKTYNIRYYILETVGYVEVISSPTKYVEL